MRWLSGDPASLELLAGSPVNCLLVEREHWSPEFVRAARERRFAVLGVLHSGEGAGEAARLGLDALVLEGDFQARAEGIPVIRLASRRRLAALAGEPVAGTWQGVWPGLRVAESPVAGPTAAPWLDTNSGLVKFAREIGGGIVWMGNRPPPGSIYPIARYLQAVADAALGGGRWIVALDADMNRRLLAGDARVMSEWRRICELLRFFEDHADWRRMRPYGRLAVAQSFEDGGFVSGGVLDMIAVQHVPVRPAQAKPSEGVRILVDGKVAATAPEGWQFPMMGAEEFVLRKEDLPKLDPIWKAVREVVEGKNLGVRVFNAPSLLTSPLVSGDGSKLALLLVNYTGYPAEAITLHVAGKWNKAALLTPNQPPKDLEIYPVRDGVGLEIERIGVAAAVELEAAERR
jgi:hypothetical protein